MGQYDLKWPKVTKNGSKWLKMDLMIKIIEIFKYAAGLDNIFQSGGSFIVIASESGLVL